MICGEQSPAYVFADLGCDVYIGNNRGTVYSLKHKIHEVASKEYWNYSF
jgi:lysosomal acid lipase/cholesteryl ester hydrolase